MYFDAPKVKNEIIAWIADYFNNNGKGCLAVIGLSGGKDSTVTAALCVKALGAERVFAVLMPQGRQWDIDTAKEIAEFLKIKSCEINILDTVNSIVNAVENAGNPLNETARVNIPARVRMTLLYALSAIACGRVANTGNLSEDYIGYSTKFGDSAGDFSPLSSLTATEVKAIGRELELPVRFIEKIPEDGLSGKTDEENFGFSYEILDRYIMEGICEDPEIKEKIDRLHKNNLHKSQHIPSYKICR